MQRTEHWSSPDHKVTVMEIEVSEDDTVTIPYDIFDWLMGKTKWGLIPPPEWTVTSDGA